MKRNAHARMHFICLRRKFRELSCLIVFSSREILQLICFDEPGLLFHKTLIARCDAIKLWISRWSLLRDRFASFISLSPTLHLFTIRAHLGRPETSRLLQCIFAFRSSGEIAAAGWIHLAESQYARNVLCIHTQRHRMRERKSRRYAPSEASTLARFIVFLLMPRLTLRE